MLKKLSAFAFVLALSVPVAALCATIDPSLIPDGTYSAKVDKVVDAKHLDILLDNGTETVIASGRDAVVFTAVKPLDEIKCGIIKGVIVAYIDETQKPH